MNPRRLCCVLSFGLIHWSGRSNGHVIKCDHCSAGRYGVGAVIFDKAKPDLYARVDAWAMTAIAYTFLVLLIRTVIFLLT